MGCCGAGSSVLCCGWSLQTGAIVIGSVSLYAAVETLYSGITGQSFSNSVGLWDTKVLQIVIPILVIVVTILLLIAATKNSRPGLILPWLILNVITILLILGFGLYIAIILLLHNMLGIGFASLFATLIQTGIYIYCWVVIVRYYKHLKEQPLVPTVEYSSVTNPLP